MAADSGWRNVRNWDKWQSYRKDRGQPPWIKIHREVMRNPEWVSLSDAQRGQLVAIWLLAADRNGVIPASPQLIRKLCFLDSDPDLQTFEKLGFIEPDANVTPERRQHDQPEKRRVETDKSRVEKKRDRDFGDHDAAMFARFWERYPRGDGKQAARKAWTNAKVDDQTLSDILNALDWQIPDWVEKNRKSGYNPPHASTYLNQRRWEDDPPKQHVPEGVFRGDEEIPF